MFSEAQTESYRKQFLPEVDHKLAVWQAYLNTLNAFNGLEMMTLAEQGAMVGQSSVPKDRFIYCLAILDGLIHEDKDDAFKKEKPDNVPDMMDQKLSLSHFLRYWVRVDKLMRDSGFYTTQKLDLGHL